MRPCLRDLTCISSTIALEAYPRTSSGYLPALSTPSRRMHGIVIAVVERGFRDQLLRYLLRNHQHLKSSCTCYSYVAPVWRSRENRSMVCACGRQWQRESLVSFVKSSPRLSMADRKLCTYSVNQWACGAGIRDLFPFRQIYVRILSSMQYL